MNCIGPTARSQTGWPSNFPPSVSRIARNGPPVSAGPRMRGATSPLGRITAPREVPWPLSTRPIAARAHHEMRHPGARNRRSGPRFTYASYLRVGMSSTAMVRSASRSSSDRSMSPRRNRSAAASMRARASARATSRRASASTSASTAAITRRDRLGVRTDRAVTRDRAASAAAVSRATRRSARLRTPASSRSPERRYSSAHVAEGVADGLGQRERAGALRRVRHERRTQLHGIGGSGDVGRDRCVDIGPPVVAVQLELRFGASVQRADLGVEVRQFRSGPLGLRRRGHHVGSAALDRRFALAHRDTRRLDLGEHERDRRVPVDLEPPGGNDDGPGDEHGGREPEHARAPAVSSRTVVARRTWCATGHRGATHHRIATCPWCAPSSAVRLGVLPVRHERPERRQEDQRLVEHGVVAGARQLHHGSHPAEPLEHGVTDVAGDEAVLGAQRGPDGR